ncbi:MAG: type I-MYXAN CRISPR-associated protein Cas5/Cmx5/DevS [Holophagales bacterium]|jgi:CRISPR-associated protein Cas5t|nr:type I-MYXAN CRISPR-associated protein Cas5/Cmx5/DevS [Holophagales bacterium]
MIALRITVPIACWRKGHAREYWETEILPPPATCYGALLSLVGETDRETHIGVRITAGLLNRPTLSTVLRTFWRVKKKELSQGSAENARPDLQQLWCNAELMIWCDNGDDKADEKLEQRVTMALKNPEKIYRFGGWSLGESTHLINDAWLIDTAPSPESTCHAFLLDSNGNLTFPVWVDHVGMSGTNYVVGSMENINSTPSVERIPKIEPAAT